MKGVPANTNPPKRKSWYSRFLESGRPEHASHPADHLLELSDLLTIKALAAQESTPEPLLDKLCEHQLLGIESSPYKGAGMEYEDLRLFQRGDDYRHIHWRATAKMGAIYCKRFMEERRASLYLLLDQRAGMWFGTRKRLKMTQAAALAYYYLYKANRVRTPIGAILFDQTMQYFKPEQGESRLLPLVQEINRCHEAALYRNSSQHVEFDMLLKFALSLPKGSNLLIISDFNDYTADCRDLLYELEKQHGIAIIQVLDPAEMALPQGGMLRFRGPETGSEVQVNCDNQEILRRFKQRMQRQRNLLQGHCFAMGIDLKLITTSQDWY